VKIHAVPLPPMRTSLRPAASSCLSICATAVVLARGGEKRLVTFLAPFQCPAKLARGGVNHGWGSSRARWGDNAPTSASLGGR
jgi:hypothetical protein